MEDKKQVISAIEKLFQEQRLAVLSTVQDGREQPYSSLVAFVAADDCRSILFATERHTRKFGNLQAHPDVSLLIDSRNNSEDDFRDAVAVTALGRCETVPREQKERYLSLYLTRHPSLAEFVASDTCELLRVNVQEYFYVSRFQSVAVVDMSL